MWKWLKLVLRPWAGRYPAYKTSLRRVNGTWVHEDRAAPWDSESCWVSLTLCPFHPLGCWLSTPGLRGSLSTLGTCPLLMLLWATLRWRPMARRYLSPLVRAWSISTTSRAPLLSWVSCTVISCTWIPRTSRWVCGTLSALLLLFLVKLMSWGEVWIAGHSLGWRRGILVRVLRTPQNRLNSFNLFAHNHHFLWFILVLCCLQCLFFLIILFECSLWKKISSSIYFKNDI